MKLTLTALFDEDTRKQVREAVLGEARKVARATIDTEINKEVKRIGVDLFKRYSRLQGAGLSDAQGADHGELGRDQDPDRPSCGLQR